MFDLLVVFTMWPDVILVVLQTEAVVGWLDWSVFRIARVVSCITMLLSPFVHMYAYTPFLWSEHICVATPRGACIMFASPVQPLRGRLRLQNFVLQAASSPVRASKRSSRPSSGPTPSPASAATTPSTTMLSSPSPAPASPEVCTTPKTKPFTSD